MRRPSTAAFYSKVKSTAGANVAPAVTPASDENSSPRLAKSPPPTLSVKEERTWEHDRQRVKKTAELIKSKARKAQAVAHNGLYPSKMNGRHSSSHSAFAVRTLLDDDQPVVAESEVDWDDVASPLRSPHVEWDREPGRDGGIGPSRPEVALTDLLIARKPRHGRGRSDFEVVPHIRSVIVLDDTTVPDVGFGEPWEHVDAVDADDADDHAPSPSYAKIAALN